jgi:hypothetical protein
MQIADQRDVQCKPVRDGGDRLNMEHLRAYTILLLARTGHVGDQNIDDRWERIRKIALPGHLRKRRQDNRSAEPRDVTWHDTLDVAQSRFGIIGRVL